MAHDKFSADCRDYERIEKAIEFIEKNVHAQPELKAIARRVGLSEYYFQRLFSRWVGISPKRFLQFLTKEYAKKLLADSRDLLETAYSAGLSGPGRLHDLFVACEAVTPGEFKRRGIGLRITYGLHPSPFGRCLLAATERGVCGLYFIRDPGTDRAWQELSRSWPEARLEENARATRPLLERIFDPSRWHRSRPLPVLLRGTNFQIKVWEALMRIPTGAAVSYEDVAAFIGRPRAARAVGGAVGQNPVSFVVPCHRVIRKTADFGYYGGGPARKKAILGWEAARFGRPTITS
jgi:AraC family transcriptional regulator of adaptative response/methylated-DNA-[protein]-cysteine methyltransferase